MNRLNIFVQQMARFTQHLDLNAVSRDNRDALRYNLVVIKMNTFDSDFMGHAGYVNHSRIWHFLSRPR